MPLYPYRCQSCGSQVDEYRTIEYRDAAPECCGQLMERMVTAAYVSVFQPYVTAGWDKEQKRPLRITNSDEHRAFLRRNNYEEVGTDKSMAPTESEPVAGNGDFTWMDYDG